MFSVIKRSYGLLPLYLSCRFRPEFICIKNCDEINGCLLSKFYLGSFCGSVSNVKNWVYFRPLSWVKRYLEVDYHRIADNYTEHPKKAQNVSSFIALFRAIQRCISATRKKSNCKLNGVTIISLRTLYTHFNLKGVKTEVFWHTRIKHQQYRYVYLRQICFGGDKKVS